MVCVLVVDDDVTVRSYIDMALEDTGRRYDLGARYGLLTAQLALALNSRDRDEVLTHLLELLAERQLTTPSAGGER